MTDRNRKETTLHQTILGDIESRILSGEWPPGFRIPFEVDLARQYGCSRMTVNKVMTQLVRSGLIERQRKAGSFVRRPHVQSAVLEIQDIEAEVRARNLAYGYRLVETGSRPANAEDRSLMDVESSTVLLHLQCIHFAAGKPFCMEERRINMAIVPEAAEADFSTISPGQWLLRQVPWSMAEHRIRAIDAPRKTAKCLDIAEGEACLTIERRTWSSRGPVTWVRFTYPGSSHSLVARFTPSG